MCPSRSLLYITLDCNILEKSATALNEVCECL